MSGVDLWAALAASVACASIAMRANMLKPQHRAWAQAPAAVWASLMLLAIGLGMAAVNIWTGGQATAREALGYTVLAAVSLVLLRNVHREGVRSWRARERAAQGFARACRRGALSERGRG